LAADLLQEHMVNADDSQTLPVGLILENTFICIKDMLVDLFPTLQYFTSLLQWPILWEEWHVARPLKFWAANWKKWSCCLLSGGRDQLVSPPHMLELNGILVDHPPMVGKFFFLPKGGHADIPYIGGVEYWAVLKDFMDETAGMI